MTQAGLSPSPLCWPLPTFLCCPPFNAWAGRSMSFLPGGPRVSHRRAVHNLWSWKAGMVGALHRHKPDMDSQAKTSPGALNEGWNGEQRCPLLWNERQPEEARPRLSGNSVDCEEPEGSRQAGAASWRSFELEPSISPSENKGSVMKRSSCRMC